MPLRCLLALVTLPLFAGCGDPGPRANIEKVVPVSGTLTYQGKPLEYYQVTFRPIDGRRPAMGVTDAAGKFTLGTNDKGDGAPPGTHKVGFAFVGPPIIDNADRMPDENAVPPQPKIKIPPKYADPTTSGITQEVPGGGLSDLKIDLQ